MTNWSIDILRQSGFDLWTWVCMFACIVLASYAIFAKLWTDVRGWVALGLIVGGVVGTIFVIALPALHTPFVGIVWTYVLLCILSATFYLNLLPQLGALRMGTLLGMRVVALLLLVPMLFEPVVRYVSHTTPDRPLLFVIDASGSMSVPDVQNGPTRVQSIWQTLQPQLPKIREHFAPQFFTFSSGIEDVTKPEDLATLQAAGKSTDILRALAGTLQKTTRADAAVILLSDGIDNTSPDVVDPLRAARRPVHTVIVGSEQAESATIANVAVDNIEAPDDFTVNHDSKIKAIIKSAALPNRVVDVKMNEIDADGKPLGETVSQKLVLQPLAEGQAVELPYKAKGVGVHRLAVWIDPIPGERTTADNRQEFQGLALDPRIKVLYIEGRARPEYRELNRALSRDPNIETSSLLRIQKDRFAASGTVEGEPLKQMPRTIEEWKKFDVILLGDLDSTFLTAAQQMAIEQRCADGAGLVMIGGQNSFGPGNYKGTPIEKALPVNVGEANAGQEKSEFVPSLTPEGETHPAMEGLVEWFGDEKKAAQKQLPPLRGNVVVASAKNAAQTVLVHRDRQGPDGKPQVVLAVQNYGQGRSAAFTADTTYLWYLPLRGLGQDSPYNKFWGQMIRWLANADVRNRQRGAGIEALLSKSIYQLGEIVRIRAMVRDEKGDATRYAQVNLTLRKGGEKEVQQYPLNPSESRTGMYDVNVPALTQGEYIAALVATKDGKELGRQVLKFTIIPPADEMLKIAANPKLMAQIAEATRGFHYPLAQLPTLLDELIRADATSHTRQETIPLHNTVRAILASVGYIPQWPKKFDLPMQGLLVVTLLAIEWILRRKWQLP